MLFIGIFRNNRDIIMLLKTLSLMYLALHGQASVNSLQNNEIDQQPNYFHGCFEWEKEHRDNCFYSLQSHGYNLTAFKEELETEREHHRYNIQLTFNSYLWDADSYKDILEEKKIEKARLDRHNKQETPEYRNLEDDIKELTFLVKSAYNPFLNVFNKEMQPFDCKIRIVKDFLDKSEHTRVSFLDGKTKKEINEENLEKVRTIVKNYNLAYPYKDEDTCD